MRTIGLLGGMSWESTAELLPAGQRDRRATGWAGCTRRGCLLASVDFAEIEELQVAGGWDGAGDYSPTRPATSRPPEPSCWCCAPTRCTRWPTRSRLPSPSRCSTSPTPPRRRPARRRRHGRAAGHCLHHGAGLLPGPARSPRADVLVPGPRTARWSTGSSTTSSASASSGGVPRRPTSRSSPGWSSRAPRGSSWAAPRSSCWSARTTARSRSSRPRACTPRPPWTRRWTERVDVRFRP